MPTQGDREVVPFCVNGILMVLTGHSLYSAWKQSSRATEEFRPSGAPEPAGGMPPIDINERFFQGPRDWG